MLIKENHREKIVAFRNFGQKYLERKIGETEALKELTDLALHGLNDSALMYAHSVDTKKEDIKEIIFEIDELKKHLEKQVLFKKN